MKTEIIQAILDNKPVQYKLWPGNSEWLDLNIDEANFHNSDLFASLFNNIMSYNWRLKPEVIQIQVKLALMQSSSGTGLYTLAVNSSYDTIELEGNSSFFVKWLTDWITYTIEV